MNGMSGKPHDIGKIIFIKKAEDFVPEFQDVTLEYEQ